MDATQRLLSRNISFLLRFDAKPTTHLMLRFLRETGKGRTVMNMLMKYCNISELKKSFVRKLVINFTFIGIHTLTWVLAWDRILK